MWRIFLSFKELWFAVNRIPQQLPDGRREKLELPIHIMNCARQKLCENRHVGEKKKGWCVANYEFSRYVMQQSDQKRLL